jgi:hypothetical protein
VATSGNVDAGLFFPEACGTNPQCSKLQAIFQDDSVGMEFMTDDPSEAEEVREQMLAFECVAKVVVMDEPGWEAV